MDIKLFDSYSDTPNGWFKTDSPKSPLNWLPYWVITVEQAKAAGFRPAKPNDIGMFTSVATSQSSGWRGSSSRTYVSRWVRPFKKTEYFN
jgi:hypothetical protein